MLRGIRSWLEPSSLWIALFGTICVVALSLTKIGAYVPTHDVNHLDKVMHFGAYFVLTVFWLFALKNGRKRFTRSLLVALGLVLLGIILEVIQGVFTSYRTFDWWDALANSLGVLVAVGLYAMRSEKKWNSCKKDLDKSL